MGSPGWRGTLKKENLTHNKTIITVTSDNSNLNSQPIRVLIVHSPNRVPMAYMLVGPHNLIKQKPSSVT